MAKKLPFQDILVLAAVFGGVGLVGAYLYSKFQTGEITGSVPGPTPELAEMAMAAESELHSEVGVDPQGYNHIPIQVLGPADPIDFRIMNFTGSYQHANCADPIRTYF